MKNFIQISHYFKAAKIFYFCMFSLAFMSLELNAQNDCGPTTPWSDYEMFYSTLSNLYGSRDVSSTNWSPLIPTEEKPPCVLATGINHIATDYINDRILFTCRGLGFDSLYAANFSGDGNTTTVSNLGSIKDYITGGAINSSGGGAFYNNIFYLYVDGGATFDPLRGLYQVTFDDVGDIDNVTKVQNEPFSSADLGDIAVNSEGILYLSSVTTETGGKLF